MSESRYFSITENIPCVHNLRIIQGRGGVGFIWTNEDRYVWYTVTVPYLQDSFEVATRHLLKRVRDIFLNVPLKMITKLN